MAWGVGVGAAACVAIGLGCAGSVLRGHGPDAGARMRITAARPAAPQDAAVAPARTAAAAIPAKDRDAAAAGIDTSLPTGSIGAGASGDGPALRAPNPAAYADAARAGSSLVLTGAEAINYLTNNTMRREGPGEPLHFTYFASRGVMGDGSERGFTARRWDRERPDLCEAGPDGAQACRSVTILLDAKSELQGARLGTVTFGPADPSAPGGGGTAVLVEGNVMHFPEHLPTLDSAVDASARAPAPGPAPAAKGLAAFDNLVGHPAALAGDAPGRRIVFYARDNRRLELEPVEPGPGGGRAVKVTVGHWRLAKDAVCQTRLLGDAGQSCFKPEPLPGGDVRLVPVGRAGDAQSLTPLPETGARDIAQD